MPAADSVWKPQVEEGQPVFPSDLDLQKLSLSEAQAIIRISFDADYYTQKYHDIDYEHISAIEHYCSIGWREGRRPSRWFDTTKYLDRNSDVASADVNPLLHYMVYGRVEGRMAFVPDDTFDTPIRPAVEQRIPTERSAIAIEMDLLREHFDRAYYCEHYPDMRAPGIDPLEHYCVFGWKEGRDPCDWFSSKRYLQYNKDVDSGGINPFAHYIRDGRAEGRPVWPAGSSGPRELALDNDATFVADKALSDLVRFPARQRRPNRQRYVPEHLIIDWVIPDFAVGSGGHMTIFRIIRWLEIFGHTCRIWISDLTLHASIDDVYDDIVKHFQTICAEVKLADDGLAESTGDVVFATGWQTVSRVMNAVGYKERCYLVQDYEPSFYPVGSSFLAAEWTYTQELACICASPWLETTLATKFGRWARHFPLAFDSQHYHDRGRHRGTTGATYKLAVYGRTTTPRRCVEMVFLALEYLALSDLSFKVDIYGADIEARAASFCCVSHGILDAQNLGELYRQCDLGICFSATNYSLVPQEMMACGLPVLEIDGPSTQAIFPPGVVTRSGPHLLSIAADIKALLQNPAQREAQANAAHSWIQGLSWEQSARAVETAILDRIREGGHIQRKRSGRSALLTAEKPRVSVCIPTFNGGDLLGQVVERVNSQRCPWHFEIVIIDSSSTDESIKKIRGTPRLILETIPQSAFQHGRTRNDCIQIARGEFIAFLTQDALPTDESWLYNLVVTLDHFKNSAGAFGAHIAWPDASPFIRRDIRDHFAQFMLHPLSLSKGTDHNKWEGGDRAWRQLLHFYSDNNSCMRRSVWRDHRYPEIEYGEDHVWANLIVEAGFSRVYAPGAVVYYSHDYTPDEIEKRAATESIFFKRHFNYDSFDFRESFEVQLQRRNDSDERWALSNGIGVDHLRLRLVQNEAHLTGLRAGMLKQMGSLPPV